MAFKPVLIYTITMKEENKPNHAVHPTPTRVTPRALASLGAGIAPRAAVSHLGRSANKV